MAQVSATVDLARMLVGAGASVVAVHGRTREQKGKAQGSADWEAIRAVKASVSVPVLANGGVFSLQDAHACLAATGADGVMSAEGLLSNPALFDGGAVDEALALEYIGLQEEYPAELKNVKQHLFSMLYAGLQVFTDLSSHWLLLAVTGCYWLLLAVTVFHRSSPTCASACTRRARSRR